MKFPIYAVRDSLLGFSAPIIRDNDAVASRAFEFDCNRDNSPYRTHSEQFQLYHIGEYDTDTGDLCSSSPVLIASACDFIEKK